MSTDHYMACHKCKVGVHVAHVNLSGFYFYSGEPECMAVYKDFLWEHQNHPLEFVSEHRFEDLEEDAGYFEMVWQTRAT